MGGNKEGSGWLLPCHVFGWKRRSFDFAGDLGPVSAGWPVRERCAERRIVSGGTADRHACEDNFCGASEEGWPYPLDLFRFGRRRGSRSCACSEPRRRKAIHESLFTLRSPRASPRAIWESVAHYVVRCF